MLGLIVLIVACVMINGVAKEKGIKATPYILGAIFLAIVPSLILQSIAGRSLGVIIINSIMSILLCFIPYNMIKNENSRMRENDSLDE